ncbi:hypothetical protein ACFQQD_00965 [Citricoccus sp. GCM10030269]
MRSRPELTAAAVILRMFQGMNPAGTQESQEPMVHDFHAADDAPGAATETWQDIAGQYRLDHTGPECLLDAVEDVLLELMEALSERAAREWKAGKLGLARRTRRYRGRVRELYTLAETVPQAQMAASALELGAPAWLFDREDGKAWRREITALSAYASWAVTVHGRSDDQAGQDPAEPAS